ncbi:MAG: LysM peptidoglycan-binding domain-containing protein [Terrimicrobiaceae bacterium]
MKPTPRPPTPRRVPRRMVRTLHARAATSGKDFGDFEEESEPNMKFSHALIVVLVLHVLAVGGVFAFNSLKGRHAAPDRAKPAAAKQAASAPAVVTAPGKNSSGLPPAAQNKTSAKSQAEADIPTHTVVAGDTLTRIATGHKTTVEAIEQANGIGGNSSLRVGQVLKIPAKTPAKPEPAAAKAPEVKPVSDAKAPVSAKATETKAAPVGKTPEVRTAEAKPVASAVKNPDVKPTPVAKTAETAPATKPAVAEPPKADPKPAASDKTYTVVKGDNPYSIAKKMKVSYTGLIKANDIKDPTKLQIGQKLIIP